MSTEMRVQEASEQAVRSLPDLRKDAHAARLELATTLDAIEYKVNVGRQLHELGRTTPFALLAVAAGAALAAGSVVWLGLRAVLHR